MEGLILKEIKELYMNGMRQIELEWFKSYPKANKD